MPHILQWRYNLTWLIKQTKTKTSKFHILAFFNGNYGQPVASLQKMSAMQTTECIPYHECHCELHCSHNNLLGSKLTPEFLWVHFGGARFFANIYLCFLWKTVCSLPAFTVPMMKLFAIQHTYCQTSDIIRTISTNFKCLSFALQLSLSNPLQPGPKSRIKI